MSTLTDVVAAVVMHSSAVAFSHFGVAVEPLEMARPSAPVERVIARTPRKGRVERLEKVSDCPETRKPLTRQAVVRA
ncbi:hypothetical protein [Phenylobacterium sp.]|jgi:hypothetical protein|uniref:hypothetical protein n=1 Tax=Phenylobacterium sp. TaxID=1871053 RepID=UPI002F93E721